MKPDGLLWAVLLVMTLLSGRWTADDPPGARLPAPPALRALDADRPAPPERFPLSAPLIVFPRSEEE